MLELEDELLVRDPGLTEGDLPGYQLETVDLNAFLIPLFSMPGHISVSSDSGTSGVVVIFSPICTLPGVIVVSTPPSGSVFSVGKTIVRSVGTDSNGKTHTNTFTVTVTDKAG